MIVKKIDATLIAGVLTTSLLLIAGEGGLRNFLGILLIFIGLVNSMMFGLDKLVYGNGEKFKQIVNTKGSLVLNFAFLFATNVLGVLVYNNFI